MKRFFWGILAAYSLAPSLGVAQFQPLTPPLDVWEPASGEFSAAGVIHALSSWNGHLYVGGRFSHVVAEGEEKPLWHVAKLEGNRLLPLHKGVGGPYRDFQVDHLEVTEGRLSLRGIFEGVSLTEPDWARIYVSGAAFWDGADFSRMANQHLTPTDIESHRDTLFLSAPILDWSGQTVQGYFAYAVGFQRPVIIDDDAPAGLKLTSLRDTLYAAYPDGRLYGYSNGAYELVSKLPLTPERMFVFAGSLAVAGDLPDRSNENTLIRLFSGNAWHDFPSPRGHITTLEMIDQILYVGVAERSYAGKVQYLLKKWDVDGQRWRNVVSGFDRAIHAVTWHAQQLWVGGAFHAVGQQTVRGLCRVQGNECVPAFTGELRNVNPWIRDAVTRGDSVIVVGDFDRIGSANIRHVALYYNDQWSQLGPAVDFIPHFVASTREGVAIAPGKVGDHLLPGRVLYSDGSAWQDWSAGLPFGAIRDMLGAGDSLWLGGAFISQGSTDSIFVVKREPGRWQVLSGGFSRSVMAMAHHKGKLAASTYVWPSRTDHEPVRHWTGTAWEDLGPNSELSASLLYSDGQNLYASGKRNIEPDALRSFLHVWTDDGWQQMGTNGFSIGPTSLFRHLGRLFKSSYSPYTIGDVSVWSGFEWLRVDATRIFHSDRLLPYRDGVLMVGTTQVQPFHEDWEEPVAYRFNASRLPSPVSKIYMPQPGDVLPSTTYNVAWAPAPHADAYEVYFRLTTPFGITTFHNETVTDTTMTMSSTRSDSGPHEIRIVARNAYGYSENISVSYLLELGTSDETDKPDLPHTVVLHPAFPNPFNPSATVRFELPHSVHVAMDVVDILGRRVATVIDQTMAAGAHWVQIDARGWASGMYILRMKAGPEFRSIKLSLIK